MGYKTEPHMLYAKHQLGFHLRNLTLVADVDSDPIIQLEIGQFRLIALSDFNT